MARSDINEISVGSAGSGHGEHKDSTRITSGIKAMCVCFFFSFGLDKYKPALEPRLYSHSADKQIEQNNVK